MKHPLVMLPRESRNTAPTEFPWHQIAKLGATPLNIEYHYKQLEDGSWWYYRDIDLYGDGGIQRTQWFGPYPTEYICVERMENARRHENITVTDGAPTQALNVPDARAMIRDTFGGTSIDAYRPRR